MKVLFLVPKYFHSYGTNPSIPHPGIAQLSAVLTDNDIENYIIDNHLHDLSSIYEKINSINPGLIGITSYSPGFKNAYHLIDSIKSRFDIPVVIGGPHVSVTGIHALKNTTADFAVKHEGERTIIELVEALENNFEFKNIDGLMWRKSNGDITENPDRPLFSGEELDKLPIPDFSKFEIEKYLCYQEKLLPIVTSRGCPFLCTYCSVKLTQGRKFRALGPERSIYEIKQRVAEGWRSFDIHDDCFSLDLDRAKEFCDLLIKENLKIKYTFNNGLRADRLDYELLSKLKESGCQFIALGLESADTEVLRNIKKRVTVQKINDVLEMTHKLGIRTAVNFIIGLPGENYKKALQTIKFAKNLKNTEINMANLIPYPGTELFNWIQKNGRFLYRPEEYLNSIDYQEIKPVFETKDFPLNLRLKALIKAFNLSRRRYLQQKIGKNMGYLASIFYRGNLLSKLINNIFKGTILGRKIYRTIFKLKTNKKDDFLRTRFNLSNHITRYEEILFFGLFQKLLKPLWGKGFLAKAMRKSFSKIKPLKQFYYFLFERSAPESCIINGYEIFVHSSDRGITQELLVKGSYEDHITRIFKKYIKNGMTVLDIGANIGYFTLLASTLVGAEGKVYAFEPDSSNIELLKKSIKANNFNNIELINKAVSNKSAKCKLYMPDKHSKTGFTLFPDGAVDDCMDIESIVLDDYLNGNCSVDFIKMDIEGSEAMALEGMAGLINNSKRLFMVMEFNKHLLFKYGLEPQQLLDNIFKYGFTVYKISENAELEHVPKLSEMPEERIDLFCIKK